MCDLSGDYESEIGSILTACERKLDSNRRIASENVISLAATLEGKVVAYNKPRTNNKYKLVLTSKSVAHLLILLSLVPYSFGHSGISLKLTDFDTTNTNVELSGQPNGGYRKFVDPTACSWTNTDRLPDEVELLIMALKCDMRPMIERFFNLLPLVGGTNRPLFAGQVLGYFKQAYTESDYDIWRELIVFMDKVDQFYDNTMYILQRRHHCTYPTIKLLHSLRGFVFGSRLLSNTYDLVAIQIHRSCLQRSLRSMPKVPYLVRDVVAIYLQGADSKVISPLRSKPSNELDPVNGEQAGVDVAGAIARSGPLSKVLSLMLSMDLNSPANENDDDNSSEQQSERQFRLACRDYLVELDERWQSMEMMNEMTSSEVNGIRRYNNYIFRMLDRTKYADACSRL